MDTKNQGVVRNQRVFREEGDKPADDYARMEDYEFRLSNCTMIDYRDFNQVEYDIDSMLDGFTAGGKTFRPFKYIHVGNNVVLGPNKTDQTDTGHTNIDLATVFRTSTYAGTPVNTPSNIDAGFEIDADIFAYADPMVGSNAIGAAVVGDRSVTLPSVAKTAGCPIAALNYHGEWSGSSTAIGHMLGPGESTSF